MKAESEKLQRGNAWEKSEEREREREREREGEDRTQRSSNRLGERHSTSDFLLEGSVVVAVTGGCVNRRLVISTTANTASLTTAAPF